MRSLRSFLATLLLAALMAGVNAQESSRQESEPRQGMEQPRMMTRMETRSQDHMSPRSQEMMTMHEEMVKEMAKMGEVLQLKVDAMNRADGDEKLSAMSEVINELVKERKFMHEHMAMMHKEMCDYLMVADHMDGMRNGMMHDMATTETMGMMHTRPRVSKPEGVSPIE